MIGIRTQLALLVGVFVSVCLFGLAFFAAAEDRNEKTRDARSQAAEMLDTTAVAVSMQLERNELDSMHEMLNGLVNDPRGPDFDQVVILDAQGNKVYELGTHGAQVVPNEPFRVRAIAAPDPLFALGEHQFWVSQPILVGGARRGTIVARVSLLRTEQAVSHSRTRLLGGALALASLLVLGLFLGLSETVVRPLRTLEKKARALGTGRLEERVLPQGGRELRELADTLNRMAAALQAQTEELERKVEERTRELREANALLAKLAVTDGLTGVFNHRRFQEALAHEVLRAQRSGRPLSVLMIDVDYFKRFNDRFGHPAGDKLLEQLAKTLQEELRATDILARYGGEEFAVLLPETPPELAAQVAERVRAAVDERLNKDAQEKHVSISVGVATRLNSDTGEALMMKADQALYAAKNAGRNRVRVA